MTKPKRQWTLAQKPPQLVEVVEVVDLAPSRARMPVVASASHFRLLVMVPLAPVVPQQELYVRGWGASVLLLFGAVHPS